jgi:hypothetical protein
MVGGGDRVAADRSRRPRRIAPQSIPSQNPSDFAAPTPKIPRGTHLAASRTSQISEFRPRRPQGDLIPAPNRMHHVQIASQSVHRGSSTTTLRLQVGAPTQGFILSDISHLSDGLGQCSGVPPNLSLRSDTIWRLLFQKKNAVTIIVSIFIPNHLMVYLL